MRIILPTLLIVLGLTNNLLAEVPYIFQPNTPAKANEVNENFKDLSDKVDILYNSLTTLEGACVTEGCNSDYYYEYVYSYIDSNVGDEVAIGSAVNNFVIVAVPFVEHGTGDIYYVKIPYGKNNSGDYRPIIRTERYKPGISCYTNNFSGYPSSKYMNISYSHSYSAIYNEFNTSSSLNKFQIVKRANIYVSVKINETVLSINYYTPYNYSVDSDFVDGDYDLTDNFNYTLMQNNDALAEKVKTIMNYVKIEKIP